MAPTIESLNKELKTMKTDIRLIKSFILEHYELSDEAKSALKKARETPESEYVTPES